MSEQRFVTCTKHNKRRRSIDCAPVAVLDAFGEKVDEVFECITGHICAGFASSNKNAEPIKQSARRYYDQERRQAEQRAPRRCFFCGVAGHEREGCFNLICEMCHNLVGTSSDMDKHRCPSTPKSSFVGRTELRPQQACFVTCVSCGKLGHFDCSPVPHFQYRKQPSFFCVLCRRYDHFALECETRLGVDPWTRTQRRKRY